MKDLIRDIKLGISTGDYNVSIDTSKMASNHYFFFKKRKMIKDIFRVGAVLVGSRALKCYSINGNSLIDRKPNDWDFVITENQFLQLCQEYKIYDFDRSKNKYYLNRSFVTLNSGYGDSYIFPCHIQLIIKDSLTPYFEKDGFRIATLENILESKSDLSGDSKHRYDLNNILVNLR